MASRAIAPHGSRSHVLLNNSDLFKSNSGKESNSELSIFSEKNIPFYPIIRDCETMFFGKDYSLKNDTRPTIQNAYVNRAVDCFNITIITNNLENAGAPEPPKVQAPAEAPVDYASYWNTALMWLSRKSDFFNKNSELLPKEYPKVIALFTSALRAMSPSKNETYTNIASNRINRVACAILGPEKTTHLPIYQLVEKV